MLDPKQTYEIVKIPTTITDDNGNEVNAIVYSFYKVCRANQKILNLYGTGLQFHTREQLIAHMDNLIPKQASFK